jgi:hypothetical protein
MPAHDPERRDVALTALALNGGNLRKTAAELEIAHSTLQGYRDRNAERYAEIQNEQAPLIAERIASKSEAIALKAIEVEEALLAKAMEGVEDMKGTDAAAAFRNISTGKALQFDKLSNPIRGRGIHREQERDLDTILNSLARRYGFDAIPVANAAEITDTDTALTDDAGTVNARELPPVDTR